MGEIAVLNPASLSTVHAVVITGLATFFFGFGGGAILSLYLKAVSSPLVAELRSSLSFKSSIFGDGIILPLVNMVVVAFLFDKHALIGQPERDVALVFGLLVTMYFHITQAMRGLVNWSMPTPWHWNILGAWHAIYMFSVATLLSLFYVVLVVSERTHRGFDPRAAFVTIGIVMFFALLRLDYVAVSWQSLVPDNLSRLLGRLTARVAR
ncbi:MAG TPA: hypothetical protein VIK11_09345 [Tepidiformaceae bacterium]